MGGVTLAECSLCCCFAVLQDGDHVSPSQAAGYPETDRVFCELSEFYPAPSCGCSLLF